MTIALAVVAIVLTGISGVPAALLPRGSRLGERAAVALMVAGSACGLACALRAGAAAHEASLALPWRVPAGALGLRVDAVSAMFLAQVFVVAPLASVYGLGYWAAAEHPDSGRRLHLFFGLLTAGMATVVVAHDTVLFLVAWEVMALAGFFVITVEDGSAPVREAGFVYVVATRVASLCLLTMFILLHHATGAWDFAAGPGTLSPRVAAAVFLLALVGFGIKAGLMPLHVWLPGAHANAPSHVSAVMSGVLLKMGIYGLVRVCALLQEPPLWWGGALLVLGVVSGVLGVAFAIGQHDIKRLLAYHSVENIGIITIGLGVAVIGRATGRPALVVLGLAGALLHVWNHGLFKALLFLGAGSVVHATHTREIDSLGGLAKSMPRTAAAFLVGALAISGLPPLNGFVSELFVYLGLFRTVVVDGSRVWVLGALGAPALALIGALAVACFVKVYGAVFLGSARSRHAEDARESGPAMLAPMLVLAACCALVGLAPAAVAPALDGAVAVWAPRASGPVAAVGALAPLGWLSVLAIALVALLLAGWVLVRPARRAPSGPTWDCGYAAPSARMQYTSSSFAELLVGLFSWALRPRVHAVRLAAPFPGPARFESEVPDTVLDRAVLPASRRAERALLWFRWLQQGSVHLYLLYMFVALVAALWFRR